MQEVELILAPLVAVAALASVARALRVPYPILLVPGGLAIPFTVVSGAPLPGRDLIALTFCVILVTLVLQGLSLPILIRRLGVSADQTAQREQDQARLAAAQAALDRLDELAGEGWAEKELLSRLRSRYSHLAGDLAYETEPDDQARHAAPRRMALELIEAERQAVIELRNR
jgi:hypothetical protein